MNVNFATPFFKFNLEVVDIDDNSQSFEIFLTIEIKQFQTSFVYNTNLWIEYEMWENFLKSLNPITISKFSDIEENFFFCLTNVNHKQTLEWEFKYKMLEGHEAYGNFVFLIDDDLLGNICQAFVDFPIWW